MHKVLHCLTDEHDLWLVALAGVICLLSALTAVSLIGRARDSSQFRSRIGWLVTAAVATGFGIWSTHFIAMLAYEPGVPIGYDLALTVISAVIAIVVTGIGITTYLAWQHAAAPMAAGAAMGAGIAGMHYLGMAAVRVPGRVAYDPQIVVWSVVLGVTLGALALRIMDRRSSGPGMLGAALVLTLAICSMHFSAMGAMTLVPIPEMAMPQHVVSEQWLAVGIAGATITVTLLCLVSSLVDQHLMRRTVQESQRLEVLTNASTEGIVICKDDRIEYGNTAFLALTGFTAEELSGVSLDDFLDEWTHQQILAAWEGGRGTPDAAMEATLRTRSGDPVPVELLPRHLPVRRGRPRLVLVARDLSEQKRSQARIEYLAHHDALTGLANRTRFGDRLDHDLARAARAGEQVAVLCIDLDRFKEINDALGHAAGDRLLEQVAARITGAVRATDTVARLSGDEFAIVQVGAEQPGGAQRLAARLIALLAEAFRLENGSAASGGSIGVAVYPEDGESPDELLRHADTALHRAKSEGRSTYRFFEREMDLNMRERRELEAELREAIQSGELHLEYQPLADARSGAFTGFEALVRWHHPERGRLPPGEFIPLAEESGLIVQLGEWVLGRACRDAAGWPKPLKVAVNLSPVQFQRSDLSEAVERILGQTGLEPARLEVEITEGVLLADKESAFHILTALKRLGVSIVMDDFGTGYSSLSYLQSFPFDKIKIDRSFVSGLENNDDARAIVRAVIGLGHALKLPMVAEGVESTFQLEFLRRERCTEVQGYFIGRPARIETFVLADDTQEQRRA